MAILRIPFLLSLFFLGLFGLNAQNFNLLGSANIQAEAAMSQVTEVYIYFEKQNLDSVQLSWRKTSVDMPTGWFIDMCDLGACYSGIPSSGVMDYMRDSIKAYVKLVVRPEGNAGSSRTTFRIFETGVPQDYIDIEFIVHTPGFVSAGEQVLEQSVQVSPNPVRNVLFWENKKDAPVTMWLISAASGRIQWTGKLKAKESGTLAVQHLPKGLYFLKYGLTVQKMVLD